jgi:hypothetical protein
MLIWKDSRSAKALEEMIALLSADPPDEIERRIIVANRLSTLLTSFRISIEQGRALRDAMARKARAMAEHARVVELDRTSRESLAIAVANARGPREAATAMGLDLEAPDATLRRTGQGSAWAEAREELARAEARLVPARAVEDAAYELQLATKTESACMAPLAGRK